MTKRDPLLTKMDKFGADLMASADSDTVDAANIRERVAVLSAMTRYLAVKHKIEPDSDDGDDFLGTARTQLAGAPPPPGNRQRRSGGAGAARGPDTIPLNPPAPAGRAVRLADGDAGPGEDSGNIGQTGSRFWRPAGNGADPLGEAAAAAGAGGGADPGNHGDA